MRAASSSREDETARAPAGTAYGCGRAGRRTAGGSSLTLFVLASTARSGFAAQPVSAAASSATHAATVTIPRDMTLLPMTPIYLPLGNYPSVSALVSEEAAVRETTGERAALRFETVDSEHGFARLGDQWNDLVYTSPRPSPFMLHCWLLEWWRHYGEGCRLAVETAYRGDRLVGALPLVTFARGGLRVATFIGARQSCLGDVLLAEGEGPSSSRRSSAVRVHPTTTTPTCSAWPPTRASPR